MLHIIWLTNFLSDSRYLVKIKGKLSSILPKAPISVVPGGRARGGMFTIHLKEVPAIQTTPWGSSKTDQFMDDFTEHNMIINGGKSQLNLVTNRKYVHNITI